MGLVTAKLEDTAAHVVALSILLLNLRKIQYAFLQFLNWLLGFFATVRKTEGCSVDISYEDESCMEGSRFLTLRRKFWRNVNGKPI